MKEFLEEVFAMILTMMLIVALTVSWVCVVVVGTEIFLPIAGLVTALAVVLISGVLKGGYGRKTLGGYHWEYADGSEIVYPANDNELVIHFEDPSECQDFYDKLLAWKRLKDKGFRFDCWDENHHNLGIAEFSFPSVENSVYDFQKDLDLLFGGEE